MSYTLTKWDFFSQKMSYTPIKRVLPEVLNFLNQNQMKINQMFNKAL